MANFSFHSFQPSSQQSGGEAGYCAAVGFFDGVHRGHCYLIDQIKAEAERRGLLPMVVTFEEHPRLALSHTRYWPELLNELRQTLDMISREPLSPGLRSAWGQVVKKICKSGSSR